jgi:hypothetical protein
VTETGGAAGVRGPPRGRRKAALRAQKGRREGAAASGAGAAPSGSSVSLYELGVEGADLRV